MKMMHQLTHSNDLQQITSAHMLSIANTVPSLAIQNLRQ